MFATVKRVCCFTTIGLGILVLATPASAQYRYRYPYPYPPAVYAPYAGRGGALAGSADVINAQGNFQIQQEQARVGREKAYQEFLKSQKQALELKKYIEANTPTYTETQEKEKGMRTRRILNNPTSTEIASGEALNVMLSFLQQMGAQGALGPPIALNSQTLDKINLTTPSDKSNVSMLRNGGQLDWPLPVRGSSLQKELAKSIPKVVSEAAKGTLEPKFYYQVRNDVRKLRDDVKAQYANEKMDAGSYLIADDFLEKLNFAVTELEKPGASRLLVGNYKPQGRNVQELVSNMSQRGLKFAPASPGDEPAYTALQNAVASYAIGAQHSYGFQLQTVAPRKEFKVQQ